jgi:hypothetical protein
MLHHILILGKNVLCIWGSVKLCSKPDAFLRLKKCLWNNDVKYEHVYFCDIKFNNLKALFHFKLDSCYN